MQPNDVGIKAWLIQVGLVVFLTVMIHTLEVLLHTRLKSKFAATKNAWDDTILYAIHRPFGALIWLLGITYAINIIHVSSSEPIALFSLVEPIREIGLTLVLVWFLIRLIRRLEQNLITREDPHMDRTSVNAIGQVLRATVMITGTLVVLAILGIPISGVMAFGGFGGIAVGFAAKDMLANFFGGLFVYLDKPFKVGDWIRSPDRNIEGTVEYIGWRLTRIRTFDKRPLYLPNGIFSTIALENASRMTNRRIKTNIGVRYDDASRVADIVDAVKTMLTNHPEIDTKQTLIVNLVRFGDSALEFMVYTFTKTTNWVRFQEIQQDVFLKIIDIIEQQGGECAFPTTTLHIPDGVTVESTHHS